jgi:hypothetical protein
MIPYESNAHPTQRQPSAHLPILETTLSLCPRFARHHCDAFLLVENRFFLDARQTQAARNKPQDEATE